MRRRKPAGPALGRGRREGEVETVAEVQDSGPSAWGGAGRGQCGGGRQRAQRLRGGGERVENSSPT